MYEEPITIDGQRLFRPIDESLNQKIKITKEQLPATVQDYYTAKMHEQTRKAQQTGIVDHILDGD